jgi:hypothetical protein
MQAVNHVLLSLMYLEGLYWMLCENLRDKVETARTALYSFILLLLYMHGGQPEGRNGEQTQQFGRRVASGGVPTVVGQAKLSVRRLPVRTSDHKYVL